MKAFCEATHNSQSSKRRDPPPKSTQHSTPTGTRNRGLSRTTTATYTLAVHKLQRGPLSVCQNRMPCDLHVHDLIGLRSPSSFFCAGLFRFRVASGRFPFRRSDRSVVRSEHAIERHGVQHRSHPSAPSARAWPRRARARSRIVELYPYASRPGRRRASGRVTCGAQRRCKPGSLQSLLPRAARRPSRHIGIPLILY